MVAVQMPFACVVSATKLGEHSIKRRTAEIIETEVSDNRRYPGAIDTLPAVALETENALPAVIRIVSTRGAGTAAHVMFTLARDSV